MSETGKNSIFVIILYWAKFGQEVTLASHIITKLTGHNCSVRHNKSTNRVLFDQSGLVMVTVC